MPQIQSAAPLERTQKVTPVFWANKQAYDEHKYRVISNQGSTRSSKTYSICQLLIAIALESNKSISMVSPSLPHLKKGSRRDFLNIMNELSLYNDNDFNMTDQIYTFPSTGSYIEFFGAEDSGKVRGPGRDILYVNEANLIDFKTYTQLALRTKDTIFIDFNPADDFSWVYDVSDKPENKLIVSNYLNNLSNLSKEQIAEIEGLRQADINLWKVFGLGLRGHSSETIYTHWKQCGSLPGKGEVFYGQDFGYNVQSALVKIEYYEGNIYAKQLIYETKLTTADLIERYKDLEIPNRAEIFCDAAEPKTIEELTRAGYNAKPADKDVTEGIRKVKSMPVFITHDSTDLIKEIRNYKWKIDKNEKVLDEPVKFADHACDALRYGVFTRLHKPQINWMPR
jgi:phage terminase large subunit